jgi:hypothetical protein
MSATVYDALCALTPTAKFGVLGNTYAGIQWFSPDIAQPTEEAVDAEIAALDAQAPLDACKKQASYLLYETDWTTIPDITNTANDPYLLNQADFIAYRNDV